MQMPQCHHCNATDPRREVVRPGVGPWPGWWGQNRYSCWNIFVCVTLCSLHWQQISIETGQTKKSLSKVSLSANGM